MQKTIINPGHIQHWGAGPSLQCCRRSWENQCRAPCHPTTAFIYGAIKGAPRDATTYLDTMTLVISSLRIREGKLGEVYIFLKVCIHVFGYVYEYRH